MGYRGGQAYVLGQFRIVCLRLKIGLSSSLLWAAEPVHWADICGQAFSPSYTEHLFLFAALFSLWHNLD
jgi:hypothetical protein